MNELPKIGYTEYNEYTHELLKPYMKNRGSYPKIYINDVKDYISWKIHSYNSNWNEYYFCYKSDRPYYNWEELTKIKRIYELW